MQLRLGRTETPVEDKPEDCSTPQWMFMCFVKGGEKVNIS